MLLEAVLLIARNSEMSKKPTVFSQSTKTELTMTSWEERTLMPSTMFLKLNSTNNTTSLSVTLLVISLEHNLKQEVMPKNVWLNSRRSVKSTTLTISVSTEVVFLRRAEVLLEELLLDSLENSINLPYIISLRNIIKMPNLLPLKTLLNLSITWTLINLTSTDLSLSTLCTLIVVSNTCMNASSGERSLSFLLSAPTLKTNINVKLTDNKCGNASKTLMTCLDITSITEVESSSRRSSRASRSTTRMLMKWWPGTLELTLLSVVKQPRRKRSDES